MLIKTAIVEDETFFAESLKKMFANYAKDGEYEFDIHRYGDGLSFLSDFHSDYDLILLDIQMPGINGMETAKRIRKTDSNVLIVFITNMAQYAVEGYNVHAYDFILKPINYDNFRMKFDRICNELRHRETYETMSLINRSVCRNIRISDIKYIEVVDHDVLFHLTAETFRFRATLGDIERRLDGKHFSRCNSCYLVNLKYMSEIKGEYAVVDGESLKISRSKRQEFLSDVAAYTGGSV
jgi:DNA-binding LytR/AlgR family response regulator